MRFVMLLLTLFCAVFATDAQAASVGAGAVSISADALFYLTLVGVFGATLATTHPTLLDLAQVLGPDNKVSAIIEILNLTNEVLDDATAIEGNLLTGHQSTVRSGIPAPTWRKMYGGVQPTKSTSVKITDSCGMLEAYAEVDKALADLNGNTAAFRLSENRPHLEGFNQEIASTLFYGNEDSEPEAFTGLSPRFNSLSAPNGDHILVGGGAGAADNTSVWLVVWGDHSAHLIYPKGSKGGFTMDDKGQVTIESIDGAGGRMEAYRTHYRWDVGLVVRDWRYIVRIANIKTADLVNDAATGADLITLMTQALEIVESTTQGRPAFYVNRSVRSFLRLHQVNAVKNSTLSMENIAGKKVLAFDGVPVRRTDAITNTEAAVV